MSDPDQAVASQDLSGLKISTLCEGCEKMAQTCRLGRDGYIDRDIDELRAGADAECPLCLVAWREVLKLRQGQSNGRVYDLERGAFQFFNDCDCEFDFRASHHYSDAAGSIGTESAWLALLPLRGSHLRTAQLAANYEYPSRTDAESVAKLIDFWYRQCTTHHPRCSSEVSTYQPPRLLEIQKREFRLVIPGECGVEHSYATLSHCWGKAPEFLKLTSTNIQQLRQWNSTDRLPQTFQDAARLCYHLNIKYLWIDSLCILQAGEESAEDWSLHVTEMRTSTESFPASYL